MTDDTRVVLRKALEKSIAIHLISVFHELRLEAVLVEVDEEELQLRVAGGHELGVQDSVTVTFSVGHHTYTWLGRVVDVDGENVWVAAPDVLLAADRRLRPRIRVEVPVAVTVAGAEGSYTLVDVSPIGMRLRPEGTTTLEVGDEVGVTLRRDDVQVDVRAEVRHAKGGNLGFAFVGAVARGRVLPVPNLSALIALLHTS